MLEEDQKPQTAGRNKSPLGALSDLADASWDLFVMPGEYANSRFDRPLEPLAASSTDEAAPLQANTSSNKTFVWSGDSDEQQALRLPKGIKAAERLMPAPVQQPRALWFEVDGRDIKGDIEVLSREWTRLWAVAVLIAVLLNGWSGLRELARSQEAGGEAAVATLSERERQERFFEERRRSLSLIDGRGLGGA